VVILLLVPDLEITLVFYSHIPGADPGFQVRGGGAHFKKLRRAEGGAKFFGIFRVKKRDFTPKNHIFSNFRGGVRRVRPPLDPHLYSVTVFKKQPRVYI
jgi:hypothetical protein